MQCYEIVYGTGAPRIDFLCNGTTGELWLNEVNPCPGSFGYFLVEAARQPLLFSELLSALIDEAGAGASHAAIASRSDTSGNASGFPGANPEPVRSILLRQQQNLWEPNSGWSAGKNTKRPAAAAAISAKAAMTKADE